MLEPQLVAYLQSATSLVGGRYYPDALPDPHTLPAVVYQRVSRVRDMAHDGPVGFVWGRWQFDTWALSRGSAEMVAQELTQAMLGFSGAMGSVQVAVPWQPNDIAMFETETGYYRVMSEFIIWHSE